MRGSTLLALILGHSIALPAFANSHDLSSWTLEDKIGQLLMVGYRNKEQLEQIRPGGVILFAWSLKNADQSRALTNEIQNTASEKLKATPFISTDHEGGKVLRLKKGITQWADAAAIGTANPLTAFRIGKAMGHELRAIGINMNLAPVLDLGNARSFLENRVWGDNAEIVGQKVTAFVRGLSSARIIPVAKHFPGHGGSTQDPHFASATIKKDFSTLWKDDLEPFRQVVSAGVPALMTAHVEIPTVDRIPASVSSKFLQEILREKIGFQGLIVSDDIEMGALSSPSLKGMKSEDVALQSLKAGTDIIMVVWSLPLQKKIVERIKKAINDGELSEQWLNEKIEKILAIKDNFLGRSQSSPFAQNPFWKSLLLTKEASHLNRLVSLGAVQWATKNQSIIAPNLHQHWKSSWSLFVPSTSAYGIWKKFRPQDKVVFIKSRPDTKEIIQYEKTLKQTLQQGNPTIVITGPRASSNDEIFQKTRDVMAQHAVNNMGHKNQAVIWAHQGLTPIQLRGSSDTLKVAILSLHGSSLTSLKAFIEHLKKDLLSFPAEEKTYKHDLATWN